MGIAQRSWLMLLRLLVKLTLLSWSQLFQASPQEELLVIELLPLVRNETSTITRPGLQSDNLLSSAELLMALVLLDLALLVVPALSWVLPAKDWQLLEQALSMVQALS